MKNAFTSALMLLLLTGACRSDDAIGPIDLLYQRWHLERTKKIGDDAWISYDTDGYYDTEYRQDGTLIYRKDGIIKPTSCCEAGRYEGRGAVIQYIDFVACPFALCGFIAQKSTITVLHENLLELNDGRYSAQYSAVK